MAAKRKPRSARTRRKTAPARPPQLPPAATADHPECVVVGIGASAGGLEAVGKFFDAMTPASSPVAFVVIQHLDPTHPSLIAELLARHTQMQVVEVADAMKVEPNRVYVIPPGESLTLDGPVLRLIKPLERRGMRMPIDEFFHSLAEVQKERAIGIILTGAGSDGSVGLRSIKGYGGMIMAQDPETAAHDGMPRSAIQTGQVDFVLPVEKMPAALIRYVRHPYVQETTHSPPGAHEPPEAFQRIISLLRTSAHFDFRQYKNGTLERRVHRRMGLHQLQRLSDYLTLIRKDPVEVHNLAKDLLISVTSFFREPEAFIALARLVIAQLKPDPHDAPVRVWIPACATGEEAYSIAMLLLERMARNRTRHLIQVFATDVDDAALSAARAGIYSLSAINEVSPVRRKRFFVKIDDAHYQVRKDLRESVTFARQNILEDPPFSRLDLISCRNVMIYLNADAQKNLLERFHFALNQAGHLFLGSSESVGPEEGLFDIVSKKWRIYRKRGPSRYAHLDSAGRIAAPLPSAALFAPNRSPARLVLVDHVYRQLLQDRHAPAAALINRRHEILHLFGPVGQFLEVASGEMTRNLFEMVRPGLRTRLRSAVQRALRERRPIVLKTVNFQRDGEHLAASIAIQALAARPGEEELLLVTFKKTPEPGRASVRPVPARSADGVLVRQLEEDLKNSRDDLNNSIRELETANEELRASNEEAVSVNEELQSTNEELETSKEELQSLNEELSTVNAQLRGKIEELENANNDLDNLISSTEQATISLDRGFHIKWFTPAMARLFPLQASDRGRPLSDLALDVSGADLLRDARAALESLTPIATELSAAHGRWYVRHTFPYRTKENKIDGVVITFVDITDRKHAEDMLSSRNVELQRAVAERTTELENVNADLRKLIAEREHLEALVARLTETKRVQVGMDLHDNLSQPLAATGILITSLADRLQQIKSPLADNARQAAQAVAQAGESARLLARGLIPVQIEASGLMSALSGLAEQARKFFNVPCTFECHEPIPIADNAIATHLFYIAQEAVNNAARHARPRRISIHLWDHASITLRVIDDGIGFTEASPEKLGSGLLIMRYRARLIGARLTIDSPPEGGTIIQCILPEGTAP